MVISGAYAQQRIFWYWKREEQDLEFEGSFPTAAALHKQFLYILTAAALSPGALVWCCLDTTNSFLNLHSICHAALGLGSAAWRLRATDLACLEFFRHVVGGGCPNEDFAAQYVLMLLTVWARCGSYHFLSVGHCRVASTFVALVLGDSTFLGFVALLEPTFPPKKGAPAAASADRQLVRLRKLEDQAIQMSYARSSAEALQTVLRSNGFKEVEVKRDGHCFFHALALQGAGGDAAALRIRVLDHLRDHWGRYVCELEDLEMTDGVLETKEAYLQRMFNGAWADAAVVRAAGDIIGPMVIFTPGHGDDPVLFRGNIHAEQRFFLAWDGREHYNAALQLARGEIAIAPALAAPASCSADGRLSCPYGTRRNRIGHSAT